MADRVAIASDHAAIEMKAALGAWLTENGFEVADLGPATADSVDYPDYGYRLAASIASGEARWGVALCGSGIGIRSEEHTSELQSLMRISYAVFCLKKKKPKTQ